MVWETRRPAWEVEDVYRTLGRVLKELDFTNVTDPFRMVPAYTGKIAYFRLHGLGERMYYYQYVDAELQRLKELVTPCERHGREVYVLFNNLSMFEDAMRFSEYLSNGTFPKITAARGLASIAEVIAKTRFPASKIMLMKRLGWRLVEVEEGRQERLSTFLTKLLSKTYRNAEELFSDVKSVKMNR